MENGLLISPSPQPAPMLSIGMGPNNSIVLYNPKTKGKRDHFEVVLPIDHIDVIIHINGPKVFSRLDICFFEPVFIPGINKKTPIVTIYFDPNSFGVTLEQNQILENKRIIEGKKRGIESGPNFESKRQKGLTGRVAKMNAKQTISMICEFDEIAEHNIFKIQNIAEEVKNLLGIFEQQCPNATISHLTIGDSPRNVIGLSMIHQSQLSSDPYTMMVTDDGLSLVVTRKTVPCGYHFVIHAKVIDMAFIVCEDTEQKEIDEEGKKVVQNVGKDGEQGVDLDAPSAPKLVTKYSVIFMQKNGDNNPNCETKYMCGLADVAVLIEFLEGQQVPFFSTQATEDMIAHLDKKEIVDAGMPDIDPETNMVTSGPFEGLVSFIPVRDDTSENSYSDSEDMFESDEEVVYESQEDELDEFEQEISKEQQKKRSQKIVAIAKIQKIEDQVPTEYKAKFKTAMSKKDGEKVCEILQTCNLWDRIGPIVDGTFDDEEEESYSDEDEEEQDEEQQSQNEEE